MALPAGETTAESDVRPPIVALTGFMGCGKSTVGRELAARLGWAFVDLDAVIEAREQRPIREIFRVSGESAFRAAEHSALRTLLEECDRATVLALGGGGFVQTNNVDLLRQRAVQTVFLEAPVEELLSRCGIANEASPDNIRPLANHPDAFRNLYEQRLPFYRAAELTIDAHGKTAAAVGIEIIEKLHLDRRL